MSSLSQSDTIKIILKQIASLWEIHNIVAEHYTLEQKEAIKIILGNLEKELKEIIQKYE